MAEWPRQGCKSIEISRPFRDWWSNMGASNWHPCPPSVALHSRRGCAAGHSRQPPRFGGSMFEGLFQPIHLLVIFFIALLVFGPKKLPELGKGLGDGIRALKEGMKDNKDNKEETKAEVKPEVKAEVKPE